MKLSFLRIIPACHGGNYTCHYQLIDSKHNNMLYAKILKHPSKKFTSNSINVRLFLYKWFLKSILSILQYAEQRKVV